MAFKSEEVDIPPLFLKITNLTNPTSSTIFPDDTLPSQKNSQSLSIDPAIEQDIQGIIVSTNEDRLARGQD